MEVSIDKIKRLEVASGTLQTIIDHYNNPASVFDRDTDKIYDILRYQI